MAIQRDDIERIATLARLALTPDEQEQIARDLEKIVNLVSQIQAVDTTGVSTELDPDRTDNVFRDDRVQPGLTREEALKNAPDTDGEFFRVPPMLPGEGH